MACSNNLAATENIKEELKQQQQHHHQFQVTRLESRNKQEQTTTGDLPALTGCSNKKEQKQRQETKMFLVKTSSIQQQHTKTSLTGRGQQQQPCHTNKAHSTSLT